MAKRKGFTSAQKFAAALAVLKGEKSQVEMGREMGCHPTLVGDWQKNIEAHGAALFDRTEEDTEKDKRIAVLERTVGRIVTENDFLERVLGRKSGA